MDSVTPSDRNLQASREAITVPRSSRPSPPSRAPHGFTLIEVMVVVVIVGILAAIALPSYTSYINKSRARSAAADLAALSLVQENTFQKTLAYKVVAQTSTTNATETAFSGWKATQGAFFNYTAVSTASTYTLTATGTGAMSCTLTINEQNVRTVTGSSCGFSSW